MAYAKSGPSSEVLRLQQEITQEVNTDAQHLSESIFGKRGNMPDMTRVDDDTLTARYRQAYQTQDRKWLVGEAQRDPEQFVKVARRIGVMLPEEIGQGSPPPSLPATSQPMAPDLALPPPQGAPVPVPALPLPPAPPVVPGVPLPVQPVPMTAPPPVL